MSDRRYTVIVHNAQGASEEWSHRGTLKGAVLSVGRRYDDPENLKVTVIDDRRDSPLQHCEYRKARRLELCE